MIRLQQPQLQDADSIVSELPENSRMGGNKSGKSLHIFQWELAFEQNLIKIVVTSQNEVGTDHLHVKDDKGIRKRR